MRNTLPKLFRGFTLLVGVLGVMLYSTDSFAQKKKKKDSKQEAPATPAKPKGNDSDPKPYKEVITSKAKSKDGLFKVHQIEGKYYYEIPDSLLGRDMLMVTTIAKTADGLGYGGERTNTQMLRWEKNNNDILLKVISVNNYAADSLPIALAVKNSNLEPLLQKFAIKSLATDSTGTVIEATDLWAKDVQALGLPKGRRTQYKVTRLDTDRSYIEHIHTYPINIEARYVMTYIDSCTS